VDTREPEHPVGTSQSRRKRGGGWCGVAPIDFHVKDFVLHGIVPTGERKREAKEKKKL
jgi:hypothetical protein